MSATHCKAKKLNLKIVYIEYLSIFIYIDFYICIHLNLQRRCNLKQF